MRIALILGIIAAALVGTWAMFGLREDPPKKEQVELDPLVEVMELETMTANFTVSTQGTVLPRTETLLSAEVSGTIVTLSDKFVAGGVFERNEVLMRIDPTNYSVALDQAKALVKQRQIEFDGAEKLRNKGYRAEAEFASAAAALATAQAELVKARRNLERTDIRLPYAGIVRTKEVDIGQFVSPGTRLGVTFATDVAEVRLPLTDLDLAFVDLPRAADFAAPGVPAGPGVTLSATQRGKPAEWRARIVRTEGVVDAKSRVTYAVAQVEDPYRLRSAGEPLPVGTFVGAVIEGARAENVIRVPRSALRGADELLFVDAESTLRIRKVEIIRADARHVYLSDSSLAGQLIVLTALETPVNGMPVRVSDEVRAVTAGSSTSAAGEDS